MTKKKNKIFDYKDFDRKIAECIYKKFPIPVTQQEIAEYINKSQSFVSKRLASLKENKSDFPLRIQYKDDKNDDIEKKLKDRYKFDDDSLVVTNDTNIYNNNFYSKIGEFASSMLIKKINQIIEEAMDRGKTDCTVNLMSSCGNCVNATLRHLSSEAHNMPNLRLKFSSLLTIRCDTIIPLTPLEIACELMYKYPSLIEVNKTYQLPVIDIYDKNVVTREDIVYQHKITRGRLGIDESIKNAHIIVLGVGSFHGINDAVNRSSGFTNFIESLEVDSLLKKLKIDGEIAFSPISTSNQYPLLHYLLKEVFAEKDEDNVTHNQDNVTYNLKYGREEQIKKLSEYTNSTKDDFTEKEINDALKLLSIFTINFCEFERSFLELKNKGIKPYVLIVAGGHHKKSSPLIWLLERWRNKGIIDGLVTSYNVVKDFEKIANSFGNIEN